MAVEIKELVIRAELDYRNTPREGESANARLPVSQEIDTEALVRTCVKQVLKILKQEKQR